MTPVMDVNLEDTPHNSLLRNSKPVPPASSTCTFLNIPKPLEEQEGVGLNGGSARRRLLSSRHLVTLFSF